MATTNSARPVHGGFRLLEPETPIQVLPDLAHYDVLGSEDTANEYIIALYANHRMRFVDSDADVLVDDYLESKLDERAEIANALVSHLAHYTREKYQTYAKAAVDAAVLTEHGHGVTNNIVPMPTGDDAGESDAEGLMTESEQDDRNDMAIIPDYTRVYSDLTQAREATYHPHVRRNLNLKHDDIKAANKAVGYYIEKVYNAMRSMPTESSEKITRQVKRFETKIRDIANLGNVLTSISGMIVEQVLTLHSPGDHLRLDQVKKATEEDLTMKASERLECIIKVLKENKLIARDVVSGCDAITFLVAMPNGIDAEKERFAKQNAGRANARTAKKTG